MTILLVLYFFLDLSGASAADETQLTPQTVVDSVLKNGDDRKLIQLKSTQQWEPVFKARSVFDVRLGLEVSHQIDQSEQLFGSPYLDSKTSYLKSSVGKKFSLGTDMELSYWKTQQETVQSVYSTGPIPSKQFQDVVELQIRQSLWKNSFGYGDRAFVKASELTYEAQELQNKEDLEELIIRALEMYWKTCISKKRLEGLFEARERYENLIKTIKTKRRVGYARLAELEQAQAEYERVSQKVKLESLEYLSQLDELFKLMGRHIEGEIDFTIADQLEKPAALQDKDLNSLQVVTIANLELEAAGEARKAKTSDVQPTLDAVLKGASTGQDEDTQGSANEVWSFKKPTYYAGLEFKLGFGSGYSRQAKNAANARLQEASIKRKQVLETAENQNKKLQRKLNTEYALYVSSSDALKYRRAAYKVLKKGFLQGNIDISDLISAYNSLTEAQLEQIKSIGSYITTLNEYAAFRDELVANYVK